MRVDSDIPERLIVKNDTKDAGLTPLQTDVMSTLVRTQIPEVEKAQFIVSFAAHIQCGISGESITPCIRVINSGTTPSTWSVTYT